MVIYIVLEITQDGGRTWVDHKAQWLILSKSRELALWRTARQRESVGDQSSTHRGFYLALGTSCLGGGVWSEEDAHPTRDPEIRGSHPL